MQPLFVTLTAALTLTVVACGGKSLSMACLPDAAGTGGTNATGGAGTGAASTTGAAGATGAAGTAAPRPPQVGVCAPASGIYKPASVEALKRAMRGRWARCSSVGISSRPQDGILINPDDTYVLLENRSGAFVALTGLENKGHVEYQGADASSFQVDFVGDLGSTTSLIPVLGDVPRSLLLVAGGDEPPMFGRLDPAGPNEGEIVDTKGPSLDLIKQPAGEVSCGPAGDKLALASTVDAFRGAMTGTWVLCSDSGLTGLPHAGVYVGADDAWILLERQNGKLIPKPGFTNLGTVEYLPINSEVLFATYAREGGAWGGRVIFSDDPRLMILTDGLTIYATYALVR